MQHTWNKRVVRSKDPRRTQIRLFICPDCQTVVPATKTRGKHTEDGHIKTMYCYKCQEDREFEQIE